MFLHDPPSSDPKACAAVEELNNLLEQPESVGESMPAEVFKENTILLMDNARFLHSRTDIKDSKRWLRRVRFHGMPGSKERATS
jgi:alpha-ketoglutarate-dependent taurine dioxygenase